jgi:hypothetical protein
MPPPARRTTRRAAAKRGKLTDEQRATRLPASSDRASTLIPGTLDAPTGSNSEQSGTGPDWGRLAAEALERAQAAPVPSSYRAEWWPAHVRFPDLETPARLAKVYATREGLYVYNRAPGQNERATGGTPYWYARLFYDKTPKPVTGYAARNAGIPLVTEAGQVIITLLGGCGCANGALRAWRPQWAGRLEAWEG